MRFRTLLGILLGAAVAVAGSAASARPIASDVRIGDNGGGTRVVVDLTEPVRFSVFVLPDPYRVVVDLPDMQWSVPSGAGSVGHGMVQGFRFGRFQAGAARIVLDVSGPAEVAKAFLIPPRNGAPNRLVIDLKPTDREGLLAARKGDRPPLAVPVAVLAPTPPAQPKMPRLGNKKIVVIDPGHGGVDPGTIAADGTYEKHVTLQLAQELQRRLNQSGRYRVLMTRTDDSFIALRDRVQFAHDAGADLFISLHADSIHDKTIRGGTVYTLSQTASDKEAEELAADENKSDLIAGIDLNGENEQVTSILIDLAQRETMNHSASFAQVLVGELGQTVAMHRNGHRFAGFRVLKAPDVPSVLLEAGYLSNRQDEQMLRSPAGRTKLIDAVARALDHYFASAKG